MASVQVRHRKNCEYGESRWGTFRSAGQSPCNCEPAFYVVVRQGKRQEFIPCGTSRDEAKDALRSIEARSNAERARVRAARIGQRTARGTLSVGRAYSDLRMLEQQVDALIPNSHSWARQSLKTTLAKLYEAEDSLTMALKETGV